MDEPGKTVDDREFAARALVQHSELRRQDSLNAAELAVTRELLAIAPVLRVLAADKAFDDQASARIGKWRDSSKSWLLAIGALIGVVVSLITAYKTIGG